MGLGITSLTIFDGLVTITNLYGRVREITIDKNEEDKFVVRCNFYIYKTGEDGHYIQIRDIFVEKIYNEDFLTKTWEDVYTMVKEYLTTLGIEYTDAI